MTAAQIEWDAPVTRERLVARARAGDRRAFAALHAHYAPMVHAVLLARVAKSDADDLLQDVFLKALQRIHSLRSDGSVGAWLAALARNRAADHHREKRPLARLREDAVAPGDRRAEARDVIRTIRTLPDAYRETLVMRLVEGLTGPEIAALTGLTPGSVRVNLSRGMKLLRERLTGKRRP